MKPKAGNIVWIDLEMTGLNPLTDEIIEIATIITDKDLEVIAEGPELILSQPESKFEKMDKWNQKQHKKSGLWEKVVSSNISTKQAEIMTLDFIKEHVDEKAAPLAGNSIWQDRRFIALQMQGLDSYLNYRLIDVSTVKELAKRWYPSLEGYTKKISHRAKDDIMESVAELKYYRRHMLK